MEMKIAEKGGMKDGLVRFFESRRRILLSVLVVFLVLVGGYALTVVVMNRKNSKALSELEVIEHGLISSAKGLEKESELNELYKKMLEKIEPYVSRSGIAGRRAAMLKGEILFLMKNYAASAESYESSYQKGKKSYDGYLSLFNAGIAFEEAGNKVKAMECYRIAGEAKDFEFSDHALFSYARSLESDGKSSEAFLVYQKLADRGHNNSWGKLAKSRLLTIRASN